MPLSQWVDLPWLALRDLAGGPVACAVHPGRSPTQGARPPFLVPDAHPSIQPDSN
jgi:hypothetical protein